MPSPPEFGNAGGKIRIIKVFLEPEPEDTRQTDRHVRISAEIEVQLKAIEDHTHPGGGCSHPAETGHLSEGTAQGVGDQYLFKQTDQEKVHTLSQCVSAYVQILKLCFKVAVPHDRAGGDLRKEGYIQNKLQRRILCRRILSADIHQVRNDGKCIERNADRHCQRRILENRQHSHIHDDRGKHGDPGHSLLILCKIAVDLDTRRIIERHGQNKHQKLCGTPPGIKEDAHHCQQKKLVPFRHHIIQKQGDR